MGEKEVNSDRTDELTASGSSSPKVLQHHLLTLHEYSRGTYGRLQAAVALPVDSRALRM